ncbi:MAG: YARHG domain-containing protein, partial [Prevotella sp.]|nr:YARHG domain-containing protein [Prevotella sp.]
DRSDKYRMWSFDGKKKDGRILRNLPYANRGYVFKDKWLNDYFNQLWWYMPDPTWQASSSDFTPREWKLIREGSKTKKKVRRRRSIRK